MTLRCWRTTLQVGLIGTEAALLGLAEDDTVEAARENFALQRAELEGAVLTAQAWDVSSLPRPLAACDAARPLCFRACLHLLLVFVRHRAVL